MGLFVLRAAVHAPWGSPQSPAVTISQLRPAQINTDPADSPVFSNLATYVSQYGKDTESLQSGQLLALLLCEFQNPVHAACRAAVFFADGAERHPSLRLVWQMLATQALEIGAGLMGQARNPEQVSVLFASRDLSTWEEGSTMENLAYTCDNKSLFSQPVVQSYFRRMWLEGSQAVDKNGGQRVKPVMRYLVSVVFYVLFLLLLSWSATLPSEVHPVLPFCRRVQAAVRLPTQRRPQCLPWRPRKLD